MGYALVTSVKKINGTSAAVDTTGATLIAILVADFNTTVTPTDSKGNTWTGLTEKANSAAGRWFYCSSPTVGSGHTFTVGGGTFPCLEMMAFSGGATSSPFDVQNGNTFSLALTASCGSVTPSNDGSLLIAGAALNNGTDGTGAAMLINTATIVDRIDRGGTSEGCFDAYYFQTTAAAITFTWDWSSTGNSISGGAVVAVFKPVPPPNFSINDSVTVSESVTMRLISNISINDSVTVSENVKMQLVSFVNVNDSVTVSEKILIGIGGIALDTSSSSAYEAALSTYNWNINVATVNEFLVVSVHVFALGSVTGITANSNNLTFLRSDNNGIYTTEIWYFKNPDVGSNTITVTLSTSLTSIGNASCWAGVLLGTPVEAQAVANGVGNPASVAVTTISNNAVVLDFLTTSDGSVTVGTGQYQLQNNAGALGSGNTSKMGPILPPGSTTMQWSSVGVADTWIETSIVLTPIGGTLAISVSDSVTVSESIQISYSLPSPIADSVTVSESVQLIVVAMPSVSDSVTVSESVKMMLISNISVFDSVTESEAVTMLLQSNISVFDSVTAVDAPTVLIPILVPSVNDSVAVVDVISMQEVSFISVNDAVTISEQVILLLQSYISVNDTITVSESVIVHLQSYVSVFDSVTVDESVQMQLVSYVFVSDSVVVSDAIAVQLVSAISVFDSVTVSESITLHLLSYISVGDDVSVTETATILLPILFVSVSDSDSPSDAVLFGGTLSIAVVDVISVAEGITLLIPELKISISDLLSVTESVTIRVQSTISVSDALTETEQVILKIPVLFISTNDVIVVIDVITIGARGINVSDFITITESVVVRVSNPQISVFDTVTVTENILIGFPISVETIVLRNVYSRSYEVDIDI